MNWLRRKLEKWFGKWNPHDSEIFISPAAAQRLIAAYARIGLSMFGTPAIQPPDELPAEIESRLAAALEQAVAAGRIPRA